jgi:hypothetical protein
MSLLLEITVTQYTMSVSEQLAEYRRIRSLEFQKRNRLEYIRQKYSTLIIFDKKLLAGYRIARFFERLPRFNYHFINDFGEDFLKRVPAKFRYRTIWEDGLYVYDLREIGPICETNKMTEEEVMKTYPPLEPCKVHSVARQWFMVNPDTDNGLKFDQNIRYQKSVVKDMLRMSKK